MRKTRWPARGANVRRNWGSTLRLRLWSRRFVSAGRANWFFVARLAASAAQDVRFGEEGQRWTLMRPETYLAHPRGIPQFQDRLRTFMLEGRIKDPPLP